VSILTNLYRNRPYMRVIILLATGAILGAGGYGYLAPIVLPIVHEGLCNGNPNCSKMPEIPEIPEKPKKPSLEEKVEKALDNLEKIPKVAPSN
jgi:hypothetical protein